MGFKKGVPIRRTKPCPGFLTAVGNVEAIVDKSKVKIVSNGRRYRSAGCTGSYWIRPHATMCFNCKEGKKKVDDRLNWVRVKKQLCDGVETTTFDWLIEKRGWETDHKQNSKAVFIGNRAFSKECTGKKAEEEALRIRCSHCRRLKTTLRALCSKERRQPTTEENRICHSNKKYLTASDEEAKVHLLAIRRLRHFDFSLEPRVKASRKVSSMESTVCPYTSSRRMFGCVEDQSKSSE